MRITMAGRVATGVAVLLFSSLSVSLGLAQTKDTREWGPATPAAPQPNGPAPKRDLTGAWLGPVGRTVNAFPPMTPLGEKMFKANKPEAKFTLAGTNDPFTTCDPLGFPRNVLNQPVIGAGMWIDSFPGGMFMLYQYNHIWRDIWMDGRELPKAVNAKGAPDSRFYGFSVGHWDGDYTFVIDTYGLNDNTWLDSAGHPHSDQMHVEERYTRIDHDNMELTMTLDDPKVYTKPFEWITKAKYKWAPKQYLPEDFCVPSESIEYMNSLAKPAGTGDSGK